MMNDEINYSKSNSINCIIVHYITLIWAIIELTPYLSYSLSPMIKIIVFAMWLFSLLTIYPINGMINSPCFFLPALFMIIKLMHMLAGTSNLTLKFFLDGMRVFFIPLGMIIIIQRFSNNRKKNLFIQLIVLFVANLVSNIYILFTNPQINFRFASNIYGTNVGNTMFVFVVSIMCFMFCIMFLNIISTKLKTVVLVCLFLCGWYLVVLNPRAISLLVLVTFIYIYFCVHLLQKGDSMSKIVKFIIISIGSVLVILNITTIMVLISGSNLDSEIISRFSTAMSFMKGQGISDDSSWAARIELYGYSLKTFTSSIMNFILGIGQQVYSEASRGILQSVGISGHSEVFDILAQFGILGMYILTCYFNNAFKFMKKIALDNMKTEITIMVLFLFVYSVLNKSIDCASFFVIFLVFPLYLDIESGYVRKNNYA